MGNVDKVHKLGIFLAVFVLIGSIERLEASLFSFRLATKVDRFNAALLLAEQDLKLNLQREDGTGLVSFRRNFSQAMKYFSEIRTKWTSISVQEAAAIRTRISAIASLLNALGKGNILTITGQTAGEWIMVVAQINELSNFAMTRSLTPVFLKWRVIRTQKSKRIAYGYSGKTLSIEAITFIQITADIPTSSTTAPQ